MICKLATAPSDTLAPLSAVFPVTVNSVSVPTLVIFGCAFVYTVLATNALATCPDTLAPATAFAVVAYVDKLMVTFAIFASVTTILPFMPP